MVFVAFPVHAETPLCVNKVDQVVKDALKSWQVPGVAVAIVRDGKVIYLKGHGVKKLGKKDPVTPDTLFPLASCSKAFTTTAMAMLVDEAKMSWDDPVRKHVKFFLLSDPLADANVTLRDLVCHRTGLRGHDFLWYRAPWSQEESIRRIGKVKLDHSFRSAFQYQSIMFTTAGWAVGTASKSSWGEFVQKRLLDPLEMKNTVLTTTALEKNDDKACPHRHDEQGQSETIARFIQESPEPSSSVQSSARDLANWLRFQLGDGAWDGKRLVSAKNLDETHTPQIALRLEGIVKANNPETDMMSYGMGWLIQNYRGQLVVSHAGAIDGFRAQLTMVPKAKLGIVLLANMQDTRMNLALGNQLVDMLLGLPKRDWNNILGEQVKKEEASAQKKWREQFEKRELDTQPTKELEAYAGDYDEPAYGKCRITLENDKLVWRFSTFTCSLEHFQHDTFLTKDPNLGVVFLEFCLDREAKVVEMKVSFPLDVTFKKRSKKNDP